jgi:nucleoid-associated protein YgaU
MTGPGLPGNTVGGPSTSNDSTGGTNGPATKTASEKAIDPNSPKLYTVKTGDTLMTIAKSELGSSNRWKEILDLNKRTLAAPENLQLGMQLKIPAKDSAKERAPAGTVR